MADLPPNRLRMFSPPFPVTGVDLFGPFMLKYSRNKLIKTWRALFTCATVSAIHLVIVEDLSTSAFLQSLWWFVADHGWPNTIISDNGMSFVGEERELRKLVEGWKKTEDFAVLHKVWWVFNTPLSPHQGGMFESSEGCCWLPSAVVVVECLTNSYPLSYPSSYPSNDPKNLQPLMPNHFILSQASSAALRGPFKGIRDSHKRFEYVQVLVQQIWKWFVWEYLPTLMWRVKWKCKGCQLQVNNIVLLVDDNTPRGKWNLGKITEVYPSWDGIVRNIMIKTKSGHYKHSVQKCCPISEDP